MYTRLSVILAAALFTVTGCDTRQELRPPSAALQTHAPVDAMNVYLVGFHPMKEEPSRAMEAHHYCSQLNEEVMQCVLFDQNGEHARMNGIEYVISEALFERLDPDERKYWHPHNGEVAPGQLVMPGMPEDAEHETMKTLANTYGKSWMLWDTGAPGFAADTLPLGPPKLAWSFNAEGEAPRGLVADRDRRLGVDSDRKRRQREDLRSTFHCQQGVDALREAFPGRTPLAGVCEKPQRPPAR